MPGLGFGDFPTGVAECDAVPAPLLGASALFNAATDDFVAAGLAAALFTAAGSCFLEVVFFAFAFFALPLGAGFFFAAAFGFSVCDDNSKAGLGTARSRGPILLTSAAGLTPAAAAAFAAVAVKAGVFCLASISGLTMTWLS